MIFAIYSLNKRCFPRARNVAQREAILDREVALYKLGAYIAEEAIFRRMSIDVMDFLERVHLFQRKALPPAYCTIFWPKLSDVSLRSLSR